MLLRARCKVRTHCWHMKSCELLLRIGIGRPKHHMRLNNARSAGRGKQCGRLQLQDSCAPPRQATDWIWGLVARKEGTYVVGTCVHAIAPTLISCRGDIRVSTRTPRFLLWPPLPPLRYCNRTISNLQPRSGIPKWRIVVNCMHGVRKYLTEDRLIFAGGSSHIKLRSSPGKFILKL